MSALVKCPCCMGDGKETCHNPDHGFIGVMAWNEIGRLGCPVCGHHPRHKVGSHRANGGDPCEECNGKGQVSEEQARTFCAGMEYDYDDIMSQ